jgi:hypothetical protein
MRPAAWECERLRLARCGPISVYLYVLEVGRGTPLPEFLRIRFAIFNRGGGEDEGSKTIQTRPIIVIRLVVLIGCRSGWHAMHRHLATTICATPTRRFFVARDPAASGTMLIGRSRLAAVWTGTGEQGPRLKVFSRRLCSGSDRRPPSPLSALVSPRWPSTRNAHPHRRHE